LAQRRLFYFFSHHPVMAMRLIFTALAAMIFGAAAAAADSPHSVAVEIAALLGNPARDIAAAAAGADAAAIYRATAYQPVWHGDGEAEQRQRLLLAAFAQASRHGFSTADLSAQLIEPGSGARSPRAIAERDVLLTAAFLTYARKLRQGAVSLDVLGDEWGISPERFNAATALIAAIKTGGFAGLLASLPPASPGYTALVEALEHYRAIAVAGGWPMLPLGAEPDLGAGGEYVTRLRRRLQAEDGLSAANGTTAEIIAAVRRFQAQHGLEPDGRVGRLTQQALNVPVEQRIAQIAANLERWRHLQHEFPATYVSVNAADATLLYVRNAAPDLHMRVVVGDLTHPTPVLSAQIVAVTVNPPWNVPTSIARKEILPRLQRDPLYLRRNDIAIVGAENDPYGLRINWRTIQRQGFPFRLQQRPGLNNSLGVLKLEMPNRFDVYLHDTPAKRLFERPVRTFSHGCIRLEHAAELSVRLLSDQSEWTLDALGAAVSSGETRHIPLSRAVPVYVLYWTAFVDRDGQTQFRDDVYGRDPPIIRALGLDPMHGPQRHELAESECHRPEPISQPMGRLG
jgi:murein L,D-transpeptidase YcbB/YkuD